VSSTVETSRAWLAVGARVAVTGRNSVTIATVERMTATQVILHDMETRFHRGNLRAIGRGGPWDHVAEIAPLDSPDVIQQRMRQLLAGVPARMERQRQAGVKPGYPRSMEDMEAELERMQGVMEKVALKARMIKEGK
jgi:hypothetical protein